MNTFIYGLRDPRTDEYRYIGKTNVGISRPKSHLTFSHNDSVNIWVDELRQEGLSPIIDILEDCDETMLVIKEKFWINYYTEVGCKLFNVIQYFGQTLERLRNDIQAKEKELNDKFNKTEKELNSISTLGGFIKSRRKSLKVTQEDAVEITGLSKKTIIRIEKNPEKCTFENILCYMDVLGLTLEPVVKKLKK